MTTSAGSLILDAAGQPIGVWRDNQDPTVPQRVHEVTTTNHRGETIVDDHSGQPITVDVPLTDPRAVAAIAAAGLEHVGDGILVDPTAPPAGIAERDTDG